jgi:hypothetical protein
VFILDEQIVALQRNFHGDIISFKTSSGRIISYQKAVQEVESGRINGVSIEENPDGSTVLMSELDPDFEAFPHF